MLAGMVIENGKKMESVVPMEQINFIQIGFSVPSPKELHHAVAVLFRALCHT